MRKQQKYINAIWIGVSIVAVISMVFYLLLPVFLYR